MFGFGSCDLLGKKEVDIPSLREILWAGHIDAGADTRICFFR